MKLFIALLALFAGGTASAQDIFTLEQCKKLAKEHNLTLKIDRLSVEESDQVSKESFTHFFPKVSASGFGYYTHKGLLGKELSTMLGISDKKEGYLAGVTAEQPIFAGGQIYYGHKLAQAGKEISRYQLAESEKNVLLTVEQFYWSLISLYEKRKTISMMEELTSILHKDVKVAVDAGMINRNDLLQVELQQNEIKSNSLELENAIKLIRMQLAQLIGVEYTDFDVKEEMDKELVSPIVFRTDHRLALLNTNTYQLLNKNIEVNKLQLRMKRGEYLPSVGIGANYSYNDMLGQRQSSGMLYVSVSVPISDWWGGSHAIKQRKIQVRMAEYTKLDSEQKLLLQMQNYQNMLEEAYQKALLAKEAIETAQENVRLNTDSYKFGLSIISDLIHAQSLLQQSRDKYAEAYTTYLVSQSVYLRETGR